MHILEKKVYIFTFTEVSNNDEINERNNNKEKIFVYICLFQLNHFFP